MNEEVKYTEDIKETQNLTKVDMGHIVIGIFRDRADSVRESVGSMLKNLKENGRLYNIMYLSDLRRIGFDANEAFALVALANSYGWVTMEQAQTRNLRFMLTELGIKELSQSSRIKTQIKR